MSYDELMEIIRVAFSDVVSPRDNIICHECDECFELRDALYGRAPDDLTDEWIKDNFDQLPLLSDEAKQFYISAYLRVGASKPDSLVSDFVLYALASDHRWQPEGGYTPAQCQAILDYLDYVDTRRDDFDKESFANARKQWSTVA